MCSLYGLYIYVNRQIELGNVENVVLAVKHVADQRKIPLIYNSKNSSVINTYLFLDVIAMKYYKEKNK